MNRLFKFLAISLVLLGSFACTAPAPDNPTTLILVRHAEKGEEPKNDPPLTDRGQERARELARLLSQQKVSGIYSTPFARTRGTVTPLSENQGVEITEYDPRDEMKVFLESVIATHAGRVAVICGHSNTIPAMLNYLSGTDTWTQLDESDYNDIYVVNAVLENKCKVTHLTYP